MINSGLPVCPRECADKLRVTKVITRLEIDVPPDIWDNLTRKNYEIWRCGYCCFGEKSCSRTPDPTTREVRLGILVACRVSRVGT